VSPPRRDRFSVASLGKIPAIGGRRRPTPEWKPIRHFFDVQAFGVNAFVANHEGDHLVERHDEAKHEELYVVIDGAAEFILDGERHDAPVGTVIFVRDPRVVRQARALSAGTCVLAIGGTAGEAFAVRSWERQAVKRSAAYREGA
jgi:hypothetical protein